MDRSLKLFFASVKSERTKENYLKGLERFRKFDGFESYDEFVELPTKKIQEKVEDYLMHMRENDHPNSVPTWYYPIQSFLEMSDVMINFKKMRRLFPEQVKTSVERGWTTEEIRTMIANCGRPRTLAVVHFENASGGRIGLFDGLKKKHLIPVNDEKFGKCYAINGYAESREEYTTFLTPEATEALDSYLQTRMADGEILTDDSPVFIKMREGGPASGINLGNTIFLLQKKAGLRDPKNKKGTRFNVPCNHGFRHRFNEIIKSSNLINPHIAEKLMAHSSKLIPMDTTYLNPNQETLFHEYRKIIPLLTISEDQQKLEEARSIMVNTKEHENLKQRVIELEKKIKKQNIDLAYKNRDLTIVHYQKDQDSQEYSS